MALPRTQVFEKRTRIAASAEVVFRWHCQPGAFTRLQPPWEAVRLVEHTGITDGCRAEIDVRIGPIWTRLVARHEGFIPGRQFRDVQTSGPFRKWEHTHLVEPDGPDSCWLTDHIEYILPMGALGSLFGGRMARRKLERMFTYRHRLTAEDIAAHACVKADSLRIAVTGANGVIGSMLMPFLTTGGHEVVRLVRPGSARSLGAVGERQAAWDPDSQRVDLATLEGLDAVIHLGGINVASARWTPERRAAMRDSRVNSTRFLVESLAKLQRKPRVLVCASATGYYGSRGDDELTEQSAQGDGFLSELCDACESAARRAEDAGIRVVMARIGIVLTPTGGALAKMLTPFSLGLGGVLGNGGQYWSWISLDDALGAIRHAIVNDSVRGPMNIVSPQAVTNREFTATLARVLRRPALLPVPATALRWAIGSIADETALASARVVPEGLMKSGYQFRQPNLEDALRHMLGHVAP